MILGSVGFAWQPFRQILGAALEQTLALGMGSDPLVWARVLALAEAGSLEARGELDADALEVRRLR